MRTSASLITLLCGIAGAQFASDVFSGMPVTCENGKQFSFCNDIRY